MHYRAWKHIADQEGIFFDSHVNERLKGVSRRQSLEIILEHAPRSYSEEEIEVLMRTKNDIYVESLQTLTAQDTCTWWIDTSTFGNLALVFRQYGV